MGAYLFFKVDDPSTAAQANEIVADHPATETLEDIEYAQRVWFKEEVDESTYSYLEEGEGDVKTSCLHERKDAALEAYTRIFETLHDTDGIDLKILTRSCSLRLLTFSFEQLCRLTDDGTALSGEGKTAYQTMIQKGLHADEFPTAFPDAVLSGDVDPDALLADVYGVSPTPAIVTVLDVLLTLFTEKHSVDAVASVVDIDEAAVEAALEDLVDGNLLYESVGSYGFNTDHPAYTDLRATHDACIGFDDADIPATTLEG